MIYFVSQLYDALMAQAEVYEYMLDFVLAERADNDVNDQTTDEVISI